MGEDSGDFAVLISFWACVGPIFYPSGFVVFGMFSRGLKLGHIVISLQKAVESAGARDTKSSMV